MFRNKLLCVLSAMGLAICVGCDTSTHENRRAYTARAGLMPGATPAMSSIYTQNQGEVKLAPERTISYEPLESFRGRGASKAGGKLAKASGKSKRKARGGKTGPIGKLKQFFSNVGFPPSAKGDPAADDGIPPGRPPTADDIEDDEEEEDEDDEGDDEEDEDDEDDDDDEDEDDEDDDEDDEDEDEDDDDDISGGDGSGIGPQGPSTPGGGRRGAGGGRRRG